VIKFLLLALFVFSALPLHAQTVETIINGQRYLCTPQAQDPGGAGRCADVAYRGPFSREEALRLCQGARSDAPAQCALQAYRGPFSTAQAIELCTGAFTPGPSECALIAYRGPFSVIQALELCSHPAASAATAQCALDAYRGPYTVEEAISLCRFQKSDVSAERISKSLLEELIIEGNRKAVLNNEYK
jgi:hypothetical protein